MAAIYYSIVQAERYFKNEDMSTISYRQFNKEAEDIYPDITFCIEKGHLKHSIEEFQVSSDTFSDIMKGNVPFNIDDQNISKRIAGLNTDLYFIDLPEILISFEFTTSKNTTSYSMTKDLSKEQKRKIDAFFKTTYVDPRTKCFTRNSLVERGKDIVRKEDKIGLTFYQRMDFSKLKIFLHHPGQFLRNIKSPIIELRSKRDEYPKQAVLLLSDVVTFKSRNKPNEPCNDKNADDGETFRTKVIQDVNCRPSYWNSLAIHSEYDKANIPLCTTSDELRKVYGHIKNLFNILLSAQLPCTEMFISTHSRSIPTESEMEAGNGEIHILIRYTTSRYQQITNSRDFDFDSMFSAIGGFVGIFLGYSLLQATELIEMSLIKNFCRGVTTITTSFFIFCKTSFIRGISEK